jgi:cytochrome P450
MTEHEGPTGGPIGVRRLAGVAEIAGHAEVKAAARDWHLFSSDLQGDPDVRTYRQLPLEVDPPEHALYRAIIAPVFARAEVLTHEPELNAVARDLVAGFAARGTTEAIHDLAIPMVGASIAIAFGRSQDATELTSWGTTSWEIRPDGSRDSARLDNYVARVLGEAADRPGHDAFSRIATATIEGRPLSRLEQVGIANLILAGGRDTVIHLLAGLMWALAARPDERTRLRENPDALPRAIDELVRFLSPLPRMERRATEDVEGDWGKAAAGDIVVLGFARANHDPMVFEAPGELRFDRASNPHVGFGNGPHTCVGLQLARLEALAFARELLTAVPDWRLGAGARIRFTTIDGADVPVEFEVLPLEIGR